MLHAEDHRFRVAGLLAGAVHIEPEVELLHVLDLVGGHQPGAEGAEGGAALALVPLAAGALDLVFAL